MEYDKEILTQYHKCDNCSDIHHVDNLEEIEDLRQRVEPGGVMPSGQCPNDDCGALCYPLSEAEYPAQCESMITPAYSFMTFGRPGSRQCENWADVMVYEKKAVAPGKMPLCMECLGVFEKRNPDMYPYRVENILNPNGNTQATPPPSRIMKGPTSKHAD